MDRYVISLMRTPERLQAFQDANRHVGEFTHFRAVDGRNVDRKRLVEAGVINDNLIFSPGFLGCALSHLAVWQQIYEGGRPALICEDDTLLCRNFELLTSRFVASLSPDWDVIYWTWNFDSILCAGMSGTPLTFVANFDQQEMRRHLNACLVAPLQPTPLRLFHAFGTSCYSVSPIGAGKLLAAIVPMCDGNVYIPGLNKWVRNYSFDVALNGVLGKMNACVAWPPLALTPNEIAASTTATIANSAAPAPGLEKPPEGDASLSPQNIAA